MKYGIDINNTRILNAISQGLKETGNFVVDLSKNQNKNMGKNLLEKVLIANTTNIDFYVGIEFKKDISICEIFYDRNSKVCCEMVENLLKDNLKKTICEKGEHLYLLKNINAPGLYIRVPLENEEIMEKLNIEGIVNILANFNL
ncbi:hypothetical protein PMY56_15065 [Clostridium tertium]|uniref:hypothetical protein n=1 Tax=Clostridium TaxID=1485 RepID=UPI001157F848|nr:MULTISPECIES: hypothetical protein [Clostridium]MBS5306177.1 hypothetical protein [Clostridium sp.]MBS6503827.1 hypothetical protein [Clostridium sp.]MDB1922316.1 hypothetical protein [Clostridium tertium]MDB1927455.1 hypothetical protein [Clostridium tertium]MDB1931146.1 hypothetical protein [Clostridium tertium]